METNERIKNRIWHSDKKRYCKNRMERKGKKKRVRDTKHPPNAKDQRQGSTKNVRRVYPESDGTYDSYLHRYLHRIPNAERHGIKDTLKVN